MRLRAFVVMLVSVFCVANLAAAQVVDGQLGPGALYRMVRPPNWNGNLLLYAHGFVSNSNSEPIALPPEANLIIAIGTSQGFAVALSSFSENGWAVKDGVQRTQQLLGIFNSKFGAPSRVYIGGGSMGSLIAIELVEQHPGWFDGMLAACAVTSSRLQADYQANVRALFDVFYSGVLPGDAASVPAGTDPTQVGLAALAAMTGNPTGAVAIAGITQTPVEYSNPFELGNSIATAVGANAGFTTALLPELHGKNYFDNRSVVYAGAPPPPPYTLASINADVKRFDAAPSALNYLEQHYQPNGALLVRTIMLSTSRDPLVPGFHRTAYAKLVADAGQADFLVQRTINRYGHCPELTANEIATALGDLVAWVELGIKPTP